MKSRFPYRSLEELFSFLKKVPGIGDRSALRMTLYFAALKPKESRKFAKGILDVVDNLQRCADCGNISQGETCWVCNDKERDRNCIMLVESVMDLLVIEEVNYRGLYHVVGDLVPDSKRISSLRRKQILDKLLERIEKYRTKEVIIAFPYTIKGESLTRYFANALKGKVLLSRLSKGIPVGGEIEFMDTITLSAALERRYTL